MRVVRWIGLGLVALAAAGAVAWGLAGRGEAPSGVAILGDEAPSLHAALGTEQALPVGSAAFTVVSVADWDRLRYIADMSEICGPDCAGDVGLVRAVRLSPAGSRKIVFVNLSAWPNTGRQETPDWSCLATMLAAEQGQVGAGAAPACAEQVSIAEGVRWVLPLGLGAF